MTKTPASYPNRQSLSEQTLEVLDKLEQLAGGPVLHAEHTAASAAIKLINEYQRLLNVPVFPSSPTHEQRTKNLHLRDVVNRLRKLQNRKNPAAAKDLEDAIQLIVSMQLEITQTINEAAAKKRTTWTNGPDDSTPHPAVDDVEPKGRLITSPGPLFNPMPFGVDPSGIIMGSQHTNWYERLKETQRANIAKLRAEGAPDELIRQAMPRWMIAEEKAAELNEEYFNAYPHLRAKAEASKNTIMIRVPDSQNIDELTDDVTIILPANYRELTSTETQNLTDLARNLRDKVYKGEYSRPKAEHTPYMDYKRRPPQELTEAQIESSMAKESGEIRRLAMGRAASGDIPGAQLMMLHALFAQQTESEERLSKRLDRPKFNSWRRPQTDMEESN